MSQIKDEFDKRGPWITQFNISGEKVGGWYSPSDGNRFPLFREHFPSPGRVLELGCLEGGFSFLISEIADSVIAVDSRLQNLDRAQWAARMLNKSNVTFRKVNLETDDLSSLGQFDVVFNVGLLYHLPKPWELLQKLAPICNSMFLWTHVAGENHKLSEKQGYTGFDYSEYGHADPLSGMSPKSFWPTTEELIRMLGDCGFVEIEIVHEEMHANGPAVILMCRSAVSQKREVSAINPPAVASI